MQIPGSAPGTELVRGARSRISHGNRKQWLRVRTLRTALHAFLATEVTAGRGSRFQPGPDSPLGKPLTLCGLRVLIYKMTVFPRQSPWALASVTLQL